MDYEEGNKTSQKLFKTSSFKLVYGKASGLVEEKNKSTRRFGKDNKNYQNMFQTSSYAMVSNGFPGSTTEVGKMRSTNDHKIGSKISQIFL